MNPLSLGYWPAEALRMGRVVRQDFTFQFFLVTGLCVGVRLLVWFVHGE